MNLLTSVQFFPFLEKLSFRGTSSCWETPLRAFPSSRRYLSLWEIYSEWTHWRFLWRCGPSWQKSPWNWGCAPHKNLLFPFRRLPWPSAPTRPGLTCWQWWSLASCPGFPAWFVWATCGDLQSSSFRWCRTWRWLHDSCGSRTGWSTCTVPLLLPISTSTGVPDISSDVFWATSQIDRSVFDTYSGSQALFLGSPPNHIIQERSLAYFAISDQDDYFNRLVPRYDRPSLFPDI